MIMTFDVADLRRRTAQLSDDELLVIVSLRRRSYRPVAVRLATAELQRRGLSPNAALTRYQHARRGQRRCAPTATSPVAPARVGGESAFVLFCEIACAIVASIVLAVLFVSGRETQKAFLRWAGTSLALPYTVWRVARFVDGRLPQGGMQQQEQAIN
ncbi:MAG TPA: hypothetical protein VE775_08130 [Pyrinomonadaceae bacterium]|nr:hypothetical protein [Pyrinomonadaceae bacterium]